MAQFFAGYMLYAHLWCISICASKTLQKSTAIQKISVTLFSVVIVITNFLGTYISLNSR